MAAAQDSHPVGSHTLGPHVVGTRVVVRRLLRGETGPTGGPAFTDVLGTCTAWGDGVCVVAPATGAEVTIEIADIVSGKPVPPRPSVRHRVSAHEAERHALVLWPHVERASVGQWELRSDPAPVGRLLKRANSALAIGDPGTSYDDATARVLDFYAARSREPMVQVEVGSEVEAHFEAAGWTEVAGGNSHFQVASLAQVSRVLRGTSLPAELTPVTTYDGPRFNLELRDRDRVVAGARAGLSGDWVGLHAFGVDPAWRRRGVATGMLAEVVEFGAEQGAITLWLHVEVDNAPALALYGSIGFVTHHSLRYLSPT